MAVDYLQKPQSFDTLLTFLRLNKSTIENTPFKASITMKKHIYASLFVAVALLAGCSKSEPEPEPAEQVIGSYTVDKYTETFKWANDPRESSDTYTFPLKEVYNGVTYETTATLEVAKTASNIVNVTFAQKIKASNGQTQNDNSTFTSLELKKIEGSSGEFEMLDTGVKIGTIGKNAILIEDIYNDKDSTGRAYTYTIRLTGKKTQ